MKRKYTTTTSDAEAAPSYVIEAEIVPGLEAIAAQEIQTLFRKSARLAPESEQQPGAIRFRYRGELGLLDDLRVVQAVSIVQHFAIPRPKALLGNTEFRVVMNTINTIRKLNKQDIYQTFHISAAGSDSSILRRFAQEIQAKTGLTEDERAGDLWLRLRRGKQQNGWELLFRVGTRPLATRSWRVCNFEGALNATVAHAMTLLSQPTVHDKVVNLASGSGSILIERDLWGGAESILGIDHDPYTILCARQNMESARVDKPLIEADIKRLPLPAQSADVLMADLPFGQRSGSHQENRTLYPALLKEAARITTPTARFVLITHEIKLMESSLLESSEWNVAQEIKITLRGLHPRIYVLRPN